MATAMTRDDVYDMFRSRRSVYQSRNAAYDVARQRYNGVHWDVSSNPTPLNRYSLTFNYLKPFIDKSVQALTSIMPAIQVMPSATDLVARRHAEQLEGILYGTWSASDAPRVLASVAFDSFLLRRGLIYVWWDPAAKMVRFKSITPDHFYPEYDGEEMWRCLYVSIRNTDRLKAEYPDMADEIKADNEMNFGPTITDDMFRATAPGQTTVMDVFDTEGNHTRVMGEAIRSRDLKYPFHALPFVEFPCFPQSGITEPLNMIDQLVELNQYLDQLISQKADIIARYANPTILDHASGQSSEDIRRAISAQGAVIPLRRDGNISLLNWQGTVPAIDEQIRFVLDAMYDLSGKPRTSFGQVMGRQSGVSTNMSLSPIIADNSSHESLWGERLAQLNEFILMLWEDFMAGDDISFRGRYRLPQGSQKLYDVTLTGKDIAGWYKNRIKWPSVFKHDDPVYVQNHLQQVQAQPFPVLSLYTYLEEMGVEDVEAEIDRIGLQLEDPRFHPDRMAGAVDAMTKLQGQSIPGTDTPAADAVAPGAGSPLGTAGSTPPPGDMAAFAASMRGGGQPKQNEMIASRKKK